MIKIGISQGLVLVCFSLHMPDGWSSNHILGALKSRPLFWTSNVNLLPGYPLTWQIPHVLYFPSAKHNQKPTSHSSYTLFVRENVSTRIYPIAIAWRLGIIPDSMFSLCSLPAPPPPVSHEFLSSLLSGIFWYFFLTPTALVQVLITLKPFISTFEYGRMTCS